MQEDLTYRMWMWRGGRGGRAGPQGVQAPPLTEMVLVLPLL